MPTEPIDLLHERVRRWIHAQGWSGLRDVQAAAVPPILAGEQDLIIAAATAAGKTEAAFLPLASRLLAQPERAEGVRALYVSPLKALINDQHLRLDEIARGLDIPVHRWHGDVGSGAKKRLIDAPGGVLLITPESLEALFVLRGGELERLFAPLSHVVIDELHAFLASERGRQLQSLLTRLEHLLSRRVPRIGLSATLGDLTIAAEFLRPRDAASVRTLVGADDGSEVKIGVRGYVDEPGDGEPGEGDLARDPARPTTGEAAIAADLFRLLRGSSNLVFANSRRDVEVLAAQLIEASERTRVPNEFFPHHGSLARGLREEVEARLKEGSLPTTVICTSTLEMGIDLGDVASVAQIGAPPSVAALRQRMGRSGRRGAPAVLRILVREAATCAESAPQDRLREELVQTTAATLLLLDGWCEPRTSEALHLSTLIQQILSVVAQSSGARAPELFELLCERGPFEELDQIDFAELLRAMGKADLITQDARGTLLTGLAGERLVEHYTFYAAFQSSEEFRVVHAGRALGAIPLSSALAPGAGFVFAGRSWRIETVDEARGVIEVRPGSGGAPPTFKSGRGGVHGAVRARMREVLESDAVPAFLDARARALLGEAREAYHALGLASCAVIPYESDALLFPWAGDQALDTLQLELVARGVEASHDGLALCARRTEPEELWRHLGDLAYDGFSDPVELARRVPAKAREKHDGYLDGDLLARSFAARSLDVPGARAALDRALAASV